MSLIIMLVTANISPPPVVVTAKITIMLTKKLPTSFDIIPATAGATSPKVYNNDYSISFFIKDQLNYLFLSKLNTIIKKKLISYELWLNNQIFL